MRAITAARGNAAGAGKEAELISSRPKLSRATWLVAAKGVENLRKWVAGNSFAVLWEGMANGDECCKADGDRKDWGGKMPRSGGVTLKATGVARVTSRGFKATSKGGEGDFKGDFRERLQG